MSQSKSALGRFFSPENRYLAPLLITTILLVSQVSFGVLESFSRTALAIATSVLFDFVLGRLVFGKYPNLASAYITGISVGILVRSPEFWPYALCAALSITSKYVLRWERAAPVEPVELRHFGRSAARARVCGGAEHPVGANNIWPMIVVWILGVLIVYRVRRFHITFTYVVSFLAFAALRSAITGHPASCRSGAHHRAHVPAFHFLHDHRPEDHGETEVGTVFCGLPGGGGGNDPAAGAYRRCAILCAGHSRPGGNGNRDLANAETYPTECRHCRVTDGVPLRRRFSSAHFPAVRRIAGLIY
jgi:hypothetical protein